jgi:hypothetical protein
MYPQHPPGSRSVLGCVRLCSAASMVSRHFSPRVCACGMRLLASTGWRMCGVTGCSVVGALGLRAAYLLAELCATQQGGSPQAMDAPHVCPRQQGS